MSPTDYKELTLEAVVTGAAENVASSLGLTIDPGAKDLLLRASLRSLEAANDERALRTRRDEIERNTAQLIHFIADKQLDAEALVARVITLATMNSALAAFCRQFPNFFPFCPYP